MAAAGPVMAQWLVVEHVVPGAVPVQDAAKRARGPAAAPAPRQRRDAVMGQRLQPPLQHDIRIRLLVIAERGQVLFRVRDLSAWQGSRDPDKRVRAQLVRVAEELGPMEHLWRWHPEKIIEGEAYAFTMEEDGVTSEQYVVAAAFMRIVETSRPNGLLTADLKEQVSATPPAVPRSASRSASRSAVARADMRVSTFVLAPLMPRAGAGGGANADGPRRGALPKPAACQPVGPRAVGEPRFGEWCL